MKTYEGANIRNVALVGHSHSGKTSLASAMLYTSGATQRLLRVDEGNTITDYDEEEISRAMSVSAATAVVEWGKTKINLVDTPGEASFLAEARLAMAACDAAIVCVSARDGGQTGTERAFQWVRERQMPALAVLTKMDDEHARPDEVVAEIKAHLRTPLAMMEVADGVGRDFHGVIAVRTGKADRLRGDYPAELEPLATELNALVAHNQEVVERQRTHVGNLAHALKTPLSVMSAEARQSARR